MSRQARLVDHAAFVAEYIDGEIKAGATLTEALTGARKIGMVTFGPRCVVTDDYCDGRLCSRGNDQENCLNVERNRRPLRRLRIWLRGHGPGLGRAA